MQISLRFALAALVALPVLAHADPYDTFEVKPTLAPATARRDAEKLTYVMADDDAIWPPSKRTVQALAALKLDANAHSVVFYDSPEGAKLLRLSDDGKPALESLVAPGLSKLQSNNPV